MIVTATVTVTVIVIDTVMKGGLETGSYKVLILRHIASRHIGGRRIECKKNNYLSVTFFVRAVYRTV